jgi:hypothetical protein
MLPRRNFAKIFPPSHADRRSKPHAGTQSADLLENSEERNNVFAGIARLSSNRYGKYCDQNPNQNQNQNQNQNPTEPNL